MLPSVWPLTMRVSATMMETRAPTRWQACHQRLVGGLGAAKATRTSLWRAGSRLLGAPAGYQPLGGGAEGMAEDRLTSPSSTTVPLSRMATVADFLDHIIGWVMMTTVMPSPLLILPDQFQNRVGGVGVQALVASSHNSSMGSVASARAMRCAASGRRKAGPGSFGLIRQADQLQQLRGASAFSLGHFGQLHQGT